MQSPLKHIICLSLLTLLLGKFVACQSWCEAKATIAEADSLLAKGGIMRDTAVLADAICALDNPIGRVFAHEELSKAYYLMGRSLDDYHHNFADAADYYIAADRLKPKDIILHGRINSCLGYLCKQDSCFKEALVFYKRSNKAFNESGNEWYYAQNLLNIVECQIFERQYDAADSLLRIADGFSIDTAYYARAIETRGMYYYEMQQYDSALLYLESIKDFPRSIGEQCFNAHQILQCYARLNKIDVALPYAEYIIKNSCCAGLKSNAYYVMIRYAEHNNEVTNLAKYSYLREDADRMNRCYMESCAEATTKLKTYIADPHPFRVGNIVIAGCLLLLAIAVFWGIMHRKRNQKMATEMVFVEAELRDWQQRMSEKLTLEETNTAAKRKIISDIVMMHAEEFLPDNKIWKDEKELFRLADSCFGFLIYRLRNTYRNLNNSELKICLTTLLNFSKKTIAKSTYCSEDSVSTTKQRLAKKLGTSPRELRDFLMEFIMQIV